MAIPIGQLGLKPGVHQMLDVLHPYGNMRHLESTIVGLDRSGAADRAFLFADDNYLLRDTVRMSVNQIVPSNLVTGQTEAAAKVFAAVDEARAGAATISTLDELYPHSQTGIHDAILHVDDAGAVTRIDSPQAKTAIDEFRDLVGITRPETGGA